MKISVIVPFYNAAETLEDCLESLLAQTEPRCEVIAVDNGSTDRSLEIARGLEKSARGKYFRVLQEPRRGREHARNCGARSSTGEILAFTDADCVADPDWARHLKRVFEAHPDAAAAAGKVRGYPPENLVQKFLCLYTLRSGFEEEKIFSSFDLFEGGFPAANLAFRREVFESLGGFDTQIPFAAGDFDLCARLYEKGGMLMYVPQSLVRHQHRRSVRAMMRQGYFSGGAQAALLGKYFPRDWIVELPGKRLRGKGVSRPVWINLTYLDKKIIAGLILTLLWRPLGGLLAAYLIYLMMEAKKIAREENLSLSWPEAIGSVGLMLLKSTAMSAGRLAGGLQVKGICW